MKLFLISLLSGLISGMGIGGGSILIPSLVFLANLNQQEAQGINLIVFIPVSVVALIIHYKEKNIDLSSIKWIIPTGIGGAILGAFSAVHIDADNLKKYFGIFLLFIGIYEFLKEDRST